MTGEVLERLAFSEVFKGNWNGREFDAAYAAFKTESRRAARKGHVTTMRNKSTTKPSEPKMMSDTEARAHLERMAADPRTRGRVEAFASDPAVPMAVREQVQSVLGCLPPKEHEKVLAGMGLRTATVRPGLEPAPASNCLPPKEHEKVLAGMGIRKSHDDGRTEFRFRPSAGGGR